MKNPPKHSPQQIKKQIKKEQNESKKAAHKKAEVKQPNTPKTQSAIALHYDGESAPIVSVAGVAQVAERIIEKAIEAEIPIYENNELLASLSELDIGQEIPEELYLIVAQIIAFVYHLKGKTPA